MGPGKHRHVSDPGLALKSLIGVYRTSLDVDIVADIRPSQIPALAKRLSGPFYADEDMMRDALTRGQSFNVIHFASSYKFDIFPLSSDGYQQTQFSRRVVRDIVLGGETLAVPVATAEHTLLMKLVWYRSGGEVSERQWNDVRGIVAVQGPRLDREYLHKWSAYLKVTDLLDSALRLG